MTTTQQQWDLEEAVEFRRKVRQLTQAMNEAIEAERLARSNYASARRATAEARAELQAFVESDSRPCPLFDQAPQPTAIVQEIEPDE